MNQESGSPLIYILGFVVFALCLTRGFGTSGLQQSLRRLERKLDALLKHQGIELPSTLSPEVQRLAQDPTKKIAAIKLHREQNPQLGLAEAKKDVDDWISGK